MRSCIAVLTYRRLPALQKMLEGVLVHCAQYPTGIFEDNGQKDGTTKWLKEECSKGTTVYGDKITERDDLMATQYQLNTNLAAFLGKTNLGVAGNSNRALRWFLDETDADHLCLCNDDLEVLGDFVAFYAQAHRDLDIGLFQFTDFWESPTHRWVICRSRGYRIKVFPRMTGIMLSVLRRGVNKIGYFDTRFGRFGNEHCDWTNRLRFCGEIKLDGQNQMCLDVEPTLPDGRAGPPVLRPQKVESSITGDERIREDQISEQSIREAAERYKCEPPYRPFSLIWPTHAGGVGAQGIRLDEMPGYTRILQQPAQ